MHLYDIEIENMKGEIKTLKEYEGKVLIIVNTASKCGFTPQFEGLENLYTKYKDKGFEILGFPCNQFLKQDPGSNEDILSFCQLNYGVSFEMFKKLFVKGKDIHPLYDYLVSNSKQRTNKKIKWNFEKFLISKTGEIVERALPGVEPVEMEEMIELELSK
jgi:glutathione peroxidase